MHASCTAFGLPVQFRCVKTSSTMQKPVRFAQTTPAEPLQAGATPKFVPKVVPTQSPVEPPVPSVPLNVWTNESDSTAVVPSKGIGKYSSYGIPVPVPEPIEVTQPKQRQPTQQQQSEVSHECSVKWFISCLADFCDRASHSAIVCK